MRRTINNALAEVGRPFGHRVVKGILTYIHNYPGVNQNETAFQDAFADQIDQKILPKLRGLDTVGTANGTAFDEIKRIVESTRDDALIKAYNRARENAVGMFIWQGVTRNKGN